MFLTVLAARSTAFSTAPCQLLFEVPTSSIILITAMEKDNNGDMDVWYTDTGNEIRIREKISGRDFIFASNRMFYETPKVPGLTASGFKAEVFMSLLLITCFMLIAAYKLYKLMFNQRIAVLFHSRSPKLLYFKIIVSPKLSDISVYPTMYTLLELSMVIP